MGRVKNESPLFYQFKGKILIFSEIFNLKYNFNTEAGAF